jgi:hypothetical protein
VSAVPVERVARLVAKELQVEASSSRHTLYFHGESMRPFLVEGDEVVVEPVAWHDIAIGDVITYRYLDRFPTRRVMRKSRDDLLLWCENWPRRHYKARRADVLGRAVARRRGDDWLTRDDREWQQARTRARRRWLFGWRLRWFFRVDLPRFPWQVRWFIGRVLRRLGLLAPLPRQ